MWHHDRLRNLLSSELGTATTNGFKLFGMQRCNSILPTSKLLYHSLTNNVQPTPPLALREKCSVDLPQSCHLRLPTNWKPAQAEIKMKAALILLPCICLHLTKAQGGIEDSAAHDGDFGLSEFEIRTLHLPNRMKCDGCVLNALEMFVRGALEIAQLP